jgi:hypothetical protein
MSLHQHFQALTDKLTEGATVANDITNGKQLLRKLQDRITAMLAPLPTQEEQRVELLQHKEAQQRDDQCNTHTHHPTNHRHPQNHGIKEPHSQTGAKSVPTNTPARDLE